LKAVTPSNTLLWDIRTGGGERTVHRDGLVDKDTTLGIERREE
jgi:hypothetical protein